MFFIDNCDPFFFSLSLVPCSITYSFFFWFLDTICLFYTHNFIIEHIFFTKKGKQISIFLCLLPFFYFLFSTKRFSFLFSLIIFLQKIYNRGKTISRKTIYTIQHSSKQGVLFIWFSYFFWENILSNLSYSFTELSGILFKNLLTFYIHTFVHS